MSEQNIALARPGNENDCSELCFLILENHAIKQKILFKQIPLDIEMFYLNTIEQLFPFVEQLHRPVKSLSTL